LETTSSGDVILPHFTGSQGSTRGKMLTGHQIVTIRHPRCVVQETKIFFGYLTCVASVGPHHPDIVPAACITGEGNPLAIGTEPWLYFIRQARSQGFRLTAGSRNGIDISQKVE